MFMKERISKDQTEEKKMESLRSMIASFRIEGIHISEEMALSIYEKVQLRLQKSSL